MTGSALDIAPERSSSSRWHIDGATLMRRVSHWGAPVLSLILFVAIWEAVAVGFSLPTYVLPTPPEVLSALRENWGSLGPQLVTTFTEVLEGFAAAIGVGVAVALLIASSRIAERLIYPMLVIFQAVPKVAIAPVFLAWFGLGNEPRMLIAGLLAVFPIIINTSVGLIGVDPALLTLARSTGAKAHRVFWQVRLPAALPSFFAGLKLGITLAVVGAVVGEFVGGDTGLGYILTNAQGNLNMELAFAALALLGRWGLRSSTWSLLWSRSWSGGGEGPSFCRLSRKGGSGARGEDFQVVRAQPACDRRGARGALFRDGCGRVRGKLEWQRRRAGRVRRQRQRPDHRDV